MLGLPRVYFTYKTWATDSREDFYFHFLKVCVRPESVADEVGDLIPMFDTKIIFGQDQVRKLSMLSFKDKSCSCFS